MDMLEKPATMSPINAPSQFSYSPSSSSSPPSSHHSCPSAFPSPSKSNSLSLTSPSAVTPPPPPVVISPCAACKILRRRCVDKVFGASNIIKFLQELPESQRADAVSSMVYEANARIRDPVYGCAGAISQLQKQVSDLQAQLAKAQAEVVSVQCQQANLVALLCMEMKQSQQEPILQQHQYMDTSCFLDENNLGASWEPLWT
ncbi:LOB DOMAIN-CONTAINING PROTEIN 4-RELATED [Salix koriyanagi]|uniref:LOB DOMAIN-CONTAINING PROTEIN 4-RELATED n=1 Tax=Salix koriyanagi TaxID=2511006 RepID=A0A9Q1AE68_9ROSI|nr:LOB DOMAIN-CONTAINING PROTEIN 4-RELATED [Salix koriyanagi]